MDFKTPLHIGDNELEDYFLNLVIKKHIIDREVSDLIAVVDRSGLHDDYRLLVKKILFWKKNLYIQNWGTLEGNMLDIVHSVQIRGRDFREHGIILSLMLQIIEEVFDVRDTYFTQFILSDHREDIEHQLIILFKRVLDFIENALKDLLTQIDHLDEPVYDHVRSEYEVVEASLLKYPAVIFHSQRDEIHRLKNQVDTIFHDLVKKQRIMGGLRFEV